MNADNIIDSCYPHFLGKRAKEPGDDGGEPENHWCVIYGFSSQRSCFMCYRPGHPNEEWFLIPAKKIFDQLLEEVETDSLTLSEKLLFEKRTFEKMEAL